MKISKIVWILGWVGAVILMVVPGSFGEKQDQLYGFHPYIELQGEYNDNINLTQDNPQGDFITTIYPGLKYRVESRTYKFELDYRLGLNFYASESQNNYISHYGSLNTYYSFNPRWTFRLNDSLTQSREGVESFTVTTTTGEQSNVTSSSNGSLYMRHVFEPSLEYKFGREDQLGLSYRNTIYRIVEGTGEDSTENSITGRLAYWFNIRNGINLDYTFTTAQFQIQPDWTGNTITGMYNYRFNPRTMAFGAYSYSNKDFQDPGIDYTVHSPSIGLEHAFSSALSGRASLGWFWQVADIGQTFNGPSYNLSLTQRSLRTNYTLALEGGYREQYFTAENLGFSRFNQVRVNVTHRLRERITVGLTGALGQDEYQNPDRTDWNWGLTGNFSYQPLKWLTVSLEASTWTRDSDLEGSSYKDNRILFRLRAEY